MNSTKKSTVIDNVICMWWSSLKKVNLEQKIKYWNSKVSAKNQIVRKSSEGAILEEESENVTEKKKRKVKKSYFLCTQFFRIDFFTRVDK